MGMKRKRICAILRKYCSINKEEQVINKQCQVVENMITNYQTLSERQIIKAHWVFSKGQVLVAESIFFFFITKLSKFKSVSVVFG